MLRSDLGTENSMLAYFQPFLRRDCSDRLAGTKSFRYGKSVSNQVSTFLMMYCYCNFQRIEAWWGELRRRTVTTD